MSTVARTMAIGSNRFLSLMSPEMRIPREAGQAKRAIWTTPSSSEPLPRKKTTAARQATHVITAATGGQFSRTAAAMMRMGNATKITVTITFAIPSTASGICRLALPTQKTQNRASRPSTSAIGDFATRSFWQARAIVIGSMAWFLYNLVLTLTAPFWVPWMLWRANKRDQKPNWRERTGEYEIPKRKDRKRIWVHAVSVGET